MKETSEDSSVMSTADFMTTFLDRHHPPTESVEHFKSVAWLEPLMSSPLYKMVPTYSRHLKSSGEDYFFSRTINTEATIPHMVSLQLRNFITAEPSTGKSSTQQNIEQSHKQKTLVPENPDLLILITLGKQGLDGHPSTIHGGVTCALMDESMGFLIMLHANNLSGPGSRDSLYTANLNVSYRAPVPTPGDLLIKTWLVSRQGRKWYSKGQLTDRDGNVLAEADGLWVTVRRDKI